MLNLYLFAPMIWWFRITTSRILFMMFGMFLPALDSARAIINNDAESIREFLTFWCVMGISLYLEALLNVFSLLKNWPPEIRIIFTLWLTLPEFQGAFRIYSYILKPLFEKHEDEIDKQLDVLGREVRNKANRQLQTILWQLFLSPNDGLLAGALSYSTTTNVLASWIVSSNKEDNLLVSPPLPVPPVSTKECSLSQQLLRSFRQMLTDGIHADVCISLSTTNNIESAHHFQHHALFDHMDIIDTNNVTHLTSSTRKRGVMRLARISLVGTCYITITKSCDDEDDDVDDSNNNNHNNNQNPTQHKIINNCNYITESPSSETSAMDSTDDDDNSSKSMTDTDLWRTVHGSKVSLASIGSRASLSPSPINNILGDSSSATAPWRTVGASDISARANSSSSSSITAAEVTTTTHNKLMSIPGTPLRFAGYLVKGVSMSNQDSNVIVINYLTVLPSVLSPPTAPSSSSSSSSLSVKLHPSFSQPASTSSACMSNTTPRYWSNTTLYIKAADSEESDAILAGMTVVVADIKRTVSLRINRLITLLEAASAVTTAAAVVASAEQEIASSKLLSANTAFARWKQLPRNNYNE